MTGRRGDNGSQLQPAAPPYRDRTLPGAKLVRKAELILAVVLLLFIGLGWLWPALSLQVILPLAMLGIVARRPDLFTFAMVGPKNSLGLPYGLGITYITNTFVVYAWFQYVQKMGWARMIELAAAAGVLLFGISIFADAAIRRRRNWTAMMVLFLFNALYGYAIIFETNVLLDRSPAVVQESVVLNKRYIYGRGGGYQLTIKRWGPVNSEKKVWASETAFRSVHAGGSVCMVLRQGALRVPWYTAQACPWSGGKVQLGDLFTSPRAAPNLAGR
jgi:hypothetical protein